MVEVIKLSSSEWARGQVKKQNIILNVLEDGTL